MYNFLVDRTYTKNDIYEIVGVPHDSRRGNWNTGYTLYDNDFFIFANIGVPGRTGHRYENAFIGDQLRWYAKENHGIHTKSVQSLIEPNGLAYIFFRSDNNAPFIYAGTAIPVDVVDSSPVQIVWQLNNDYEQEVFSYEEQKAIPSLILEGEKNSRVINTYERNPLARRECLRVHGHNCHVCGFNFEATYGEIGREFIHVHHIIPLSIIGETYSLDPVKDLRPVCPNCHAMLHRLTPPLTIDELIVYLSSTGTSTINNDIYDSRS